MVFGKKSLILILLGVFLYSCKKKNNTNSPNQNSGSSTQSGDYGTFLSVYNIYDFGGGVVVEDSMVQANFYDSPLSTHMSISAGTVTVNNAILNQVMSPVFYTLGNQINVKSLNWQISGSGTITANTFSYIPTYPVFTGTASLQDTLSKSNNVTFNITGLSNINQALYVRVFQNNLVITKSLPLNNTSLTLSVSELAQFTANDNIAVKISMFNYSNISLSGKQYGVNANRTYEKWIYLKP